MEATETTLDTKLVQPRMAIDRTDAILHLNSEEAIKRHQSALKALIIDTDHWQRALEAQKIASKQDIKSINKWNAEVDANISEADQSVKRLKTSLEEYQGETVVQAKSNSFHRMICLNVLYLTSVTLSLFR